MTVTYETETGECIELQVIDPLGCRCPIIDMGVDGVVIEGHAQVNFETKSVSWDVLEETFSLYDPSDRDLTIADVRSSEQPWD